MQQGDTFCFSENRTRIFLLLLVAGVFIVYSDAFSHSFILNWDDEKYVVRNPAAHGISFPHIFQAFTSYFVWNYAPVQIISYMVDFELWGLNPAGYIFTNLVVHSLNGILLFVIVMKISKRFTAAALSAFIFLYHPVQVETVAWISQRKSLLAMLFYLGAFILYLRYKEHSNRFYLICSLAAFILSFLSKAVTVIFPLMLIMYEFCFLEEDEKAGIRDKIPYFVVGLIAGYQALVSHTPGESGAGGISDYPGDSLLTTLYTMLPVLAEYLGDIFWPLNLSPYYITKIRLTPDRGVLWSAVLAMVLVATGALLYKRNRKLLFWYLVFFLGLLPVSQIVPSITLKNDRYLYFPLIGLAPFLAIMIEYCWQMMRAARGAVCGVVMVLLLSLPLLSFRQSLIWKDAVSLWSHAVRIDPENQLGWQMLTWAYTKQKNSAAAIYTLERYRRLREKNGPVRGW